MSDATNVHNGGMGRRVSEVHDLLMDMRIVPEGASRSFLDKLVSENRWSIEHAERAMFEYRRFLLMAWVSPHMIVPSRDVDEVWHLHLTHSRHYWDVLCGAILQKPFHHDPSEGGSVEDDRHDQAYRRTLSLYETMFDERAPDSVWPRSCRCRTTDGHEAVMMASGPALPIGAMSILLPGAILFAGHPLIATILLVIGMAITYRAASLHSEEEARLAKEMERDRARRAQRSTSFRVVEPSPSELKERLARAQAESGKGYDRSASTKRTPSGRSRFSSTCSSNDRTGDDMSAMIALMSSDSGSSCETGSSSHSCSSSSSHSCGSSSSCGGGGGCGGGGD